MAEETIVQNVKEEETNKVAIEKRKFSFKDFFKVRSNIFALCSVVLGIIAIAFFLFLPSILIDLTEDGKDIARLNAATIPTMASYHESLLGLNVLLGGGTYTVWHNVATSAVLETQKMAFNIPMLVGLVLLLAGMAIIVVLTLTANAGVLNKVAFGLLIVGAIAILLAPIWFYAVNPITASTRFTTSLSIYEYGSINAHAGVGTILGAVFAIASAVMSSFLILKPVETR